MNCTPLEKVHVMKINLLPDDCTLPKVKIKVKLPPKVKPVVVIDPAKDNKHPAQGYYQSHIEAPRED